MTKRWLGSRLCTFVLVLVLGGCSYQNASRRSGPDVSLDAAKALITSGKVVEIFQPHEGCVVLTLEGGQLVTFEQPHLDWVLSFVEETGLRGTIPVSVE